MDGNRDESLRCIGIAEQHFNTGDRESAERFLLKAERLYPSQQAKDLLDLLNKFKSSNTKTTPNGSAQFHDEDNDRGDSNHNDEKSEGSQPRKRFNSQHSESTIKAPEYTSDQVESVKNIKKCKNYYEVLGVKQDAGDSDLKKQYRKLALQFHPDKNKAPGAGDAFKVIGNAFAVLSDVEKRKNYDLSGMQDNHNIHRSRERRAHQEYEADISAEDLFNMFFGGRTPGNVYVRRHNRWQRFEESMSHQHQEARQEQSSGAALLQMLPILVLIGLSLMSSFFTTDPIYSLHRTNKYGVERATRNYKINYYVKDTFIKEYGGNIRQIDSYVEEEYLQNLRTNCIREKNYKETMLWRARNFGDPGMERKAQELKMPSCEALQSIQSRAGG